MRVHVFTLRSTHCPPLRSPSLFSSPFPPRQCPTPGVFPTLSHQVSAKLGASSPTEARHSSPVRGTGLGKSFRKSPCSSFSGTLMKIEPHICYICAGSGAWPSLPARVCYLVGSSVSENSQRSRLVESVSLFVLSLSPSGLLLLPPFSHKSSNLYPMFGCDIKQCFAFVSVSCCVQPLRGQLC